MSGSQASNRDSQVRIPRLCHRDIFLISSLIALTITIIHVVSLPVAISYDGHLYIDHAAVLFSPRFPADWDFLRTPLYPFFLKIAFSILGKQPMAIIATGSTLAFLGLLAVGASLYRIGHPRVAAVAMVVLSAYPTMVAYEHSALSEPGTFFFLALMLWSLLVSAQGPPTRAAAFVGTATLLGYFYRPYLLFLAPVTGVLFLVASWRSPCPRTSFGPLRAELGRLALPALGCAILPFLLALPWSSQVPAARPAEVWAISLLKQGVVPVDNHCLGSTRDLYVQDLAKATQSDGTLPLNGMPDDHIFTIAGAVEQNCPLEFLSLNRTVISDNTKAYLRGMVRTTGLVLGLPVKSDNRIFEELVLGGERARVLPGPVKLSEAHERLFAMVAAPSLVSRVAKALIGPYQIAIVMGSCLGILGFVLSIMFKDRWLGIWCALPLAHQAMWPFLLVSYDRAVTPAYPLMIALGMLVPARVFAHLRSRRAARHAAVADPAEVPL